MSSERFGVIDADVVLRSVDGRDFHVHKSILSIASPVFRNMFTFPQPPSPKPSSIPVVNVSEAGNVLGVFLRCLYPVSKPVVQDFGLLEALFVAAEKYETDIVLEMVKSWLVIPKNLRTDPLRAYAIACTSTTLDKQAKVAAKWMTFDNIDSASLDTIGRLTTADHHRLVVYLIKREKEANLVVNEDSWKNFYDNCACMAETKAEFREGVGKVIRDAFASDPLLTTERATVLAFKQLVGVRSCHRHTCSLLTKGEEHAKELVQRLVQVSNKLLW